MGKTTLSDKEQVTGFIEQLDHSLKDVVAILRSIILSIDNEIGEHIKWNSPAFSYTGKMAPFDPKEYKRDLLVLHLRRKDQILLVFPTGATITDTTGLLEGSYSDGRRMVTIRSMAELESKTFHLQQVIKEWLKMVEK